MTRLTKAMILLSSAVFMVGLSACGSFKDPEPQPTPTATPKTVELSTEYSNNTVFETEKKLKDGRTVVCIVWHDYQEGGLSCDWESAVKQHGK